MRAIRCIEWGGPERLRLEDIPEPVPGPGEVRLRVHAAGVNFPDYLIIQRKYQVRPELPFTPGAEVSGTVLETGPGVTRLRRGERVAAFVSLGGFAEEVIAREAACFALPDHVDDAVGAAFLLTYGTTWHALADRAALRRGERLLVLGAAGGVGLAACDIGRHLGADVIAAASSAEKLALCREYGASETIDYTTEDLRAGIARASAGAGPDVIYDPVGGDFAEPAFRAIAWRGRYLVIGFAAGKIPALPLNLPLLKGASLVGVFWGDHMRREPALYAEETASLLAAIATGQLKPLVSYRYRLEDAATALTDMAARTVRGKIVIVP
ncbi:MAG: NADPH:quinone oxidoreductase family protein [Acidibrevibacterium sp.]|uniref:NADPH:quinone oxidoreductase family protein n=1 Tax=Acidibrevibacterium sp. TaxID=2606776 RepID=UPI003D03332F